jgi:hypothetical protein
MQPLMFFSLDFVVLEQRCMIQCLGSFHYVSVIVYTWSCYFALVLETLVIHAYYFILVQLGHVIPLFDCDPNLNFIT